MYALYSVQCTPLYICSIHPCVCSIHPCICSIHRCICSTYPEPASDIHSRLSIMSQRAQTAFVECKHVFSVFVCISCVARGQPTIVSQSLQFKCFLCDVPYVAHIWGGVGLTLIGEYFEPPRSLLGISIRSDAI